MPMMDSAMDLMVNRLSKEKKEEMMINMMPLMMDGININELMPKMMVKMLDKATVDDVLNFIKELLRDKETIQGLLGKLKEADVMKQMMFKTYTSKLGFEDTVREIVVRASDNGWDIPDTRDLQRHYQSSGIENMTKLEVVYFCDPNGGHAILKDDKNKSMSVMMPTGVTVYETSDGRVEIAAMNFGMMSGFFSDTIQAVLEKAAKNLENSLKGIVE